MSARGADFGFAKNGNEPFYSDKGFSEPCPPQKSLARCYSGSGHFDLFFSTNVQYHCWKTPCCLSRNLTSSANSRYFAQFWTPKKFLSSQLKTSSFQRKFRTFRKYSASSSMKIFRFEPLSLDFFDNFSIFYFLLFLLVYVKAAQLWFPVRHARQAEKKVSWCLGEMYRSAI